MGYRLTWQFCELLHSCFTSELHYMSHLAQPNPLLHPKHHKFLCHLVLDDTTQVDEHYSHR